MDEHLYFSAAIEKGNLKANAYKEKQVSIMSFEASEAIEAYLSQRYLSGIGISISNSVFNENKELLYDEVVHSAFQPHIDQASFVPFLDISYDSVTIERMRCLLSDYVSIAIIDNTAGRYYFSSILSMLKSIDEDVLVHSLNTIIDLITFKTIPKDFQKHICWDYSVFFLFALIDRALSIEKNLTDSYSLCDKTLEHIDNIDILLDNISSINDEIISNENKRFLIQRIYYNLYIESCADK